MQSRIVLGIKPVPDSCIKLHQRRCSNLTLRELQGISSKIKTMLAMREGHAATAGRWKRYGR